MKNLLLAMFGKKLKNPVSRHIAQTRLLHFRGINVGRRNGKVMI